MRRRQFVTLLACPKSGWLQDVKVQHGEWAQLIATLGAMALTLLTLPSSSLSQELLSQGIGASSEQQVFNNACRTCHTMKEGDNRLGPNLFKIIGRKAGSLPDYNYSSAMKGAGFIWDEEKLAHFIANPDEIVPGNTMKPYGGLASKDDRTKIISFLLSATTGRQ
jgi:cytochrome c